MTRVPSYRRHKPTGQARVTLGGKDFYLGKYGARDSRDAYQRLIGEYLAGHGRTPGTDRMTLVEVCAAYKRFAKSYYVGRDGKPSDWYAFTLPHLPEIVADMVRLQRLTGMRPAEVCLMRPVDIDTSNDVWVYKPQYHKTEHHGRERTIFIGPQAQAILRPYLLREEATHCFVPAESERRRRALQHAARATVPTYGNRPGTNVKRKPKWAAGRSYCTVSYRRAICRGCELAFGMPEDLDKEQRKAWRAANVWAPNQLRHTAATEIRSKFGLEAAQITLVHSRADITQVYAERDLTKTAQIMREVG